MAAPDQRLILTLDPALADRLANAAERAGLDPADIALRCLRDRLDEVSAYGRVSDEIADVKDRLAELVTVIGEVLAEPTPAAVAQFCRYKPPRAPWET